jgi:(p)ppGpp synthase/HD superfamily hydrolase
MNPSKTKIDKAGYMLSNNAEWQSDEQYLESEYIFDEYRKNHLIPLTEVTLKLQEWLTMFPNDYYIAQRLKRKPQILKKLVRLSVRLTQLQDIGGCRIIVENNELVDTLLSYIQEKLIRSH